MYRLTLHNIQYKLNLKKSLMPPSSLETPWVKYAINQASYSERPGKWFIIGLKIAISKIQNVIMKSLSSHLSHWKRLGCSLDNVPTCMKWLKGPGGAWRRNTANKESRPKSQFHYVWLSNTPLTGGKAHVLLFAGFFFAISGDPADIRLIVHPHFCMSMAVIALRGHSTFFSYQEAKTQRENLGYVWPTYGGR